MSPALAARVQEAVSGRQTSAERRRPLKSLLRLLTLVFVSASVAGVVHFQRQRAQELESLRASLLDKLERQANQLSRSDRELPARVSAAVALHATPSYPGDQIAEDLRSEAGLTQALAAATLYLRGPLEGLGQPARVAELAASSTKDAFALCLLAPPKTRTEQALRFKASAAYAHGKQADAMSQLERVAPLLQALPLLGADWKRRIANAESLGALQVLQKLLEAAPLEAGVHAAKARQLLLVLDETASASGPTELDGERKHWVRVVLADLTNKETRLRFRHEVDPGWLSDATRAQYASGVDGCALAMDLRQAAANLPLR